MSKLFRYMTKAKNVVSQNTPSVSGIKGYWSKPENINIDVTLPEHKKIIEGNEESLAWIATKAVAPVAVGGGIGAGVAYVANSYFSPTSWINPIRYIPGGNVIANFPAMAFGAFGAFGAIGGAAFGFEIAVDGAWAKIGNRMDQYNVKENAKKHEQKTALVQADLKIGNVDFVNVAQVYQSKNGKITTNIDALTDAIVDGVNAEIISYKSNSVVQNKLFDGVYNTKSKSITSMKAKTSDITGKYEYKTDIENYDDYNKAAYYKAGKVGGTQHYAGMKPNAPLKELTENELLTVVLEKVQPYCTKSFWKAPVAKFKDWACGVELFNMTAKQLLEYAQKVTTEFENPIEFAQSQTDDEDLQEQYMADYINLGDIVKMHDSIMNAQHIDRNNGVDYNYGRTTFFNYEENNQKGTDAKMVSDVLDINDFIRGDNLMNGNYDAVQISGGKEEADLYVNDLEYDLGHGF